MNKGDISGDLEQEVDIKKILKPHLKNYIWYILSVLIAIVFSILYIAKVQNQYSINSQIIINSKHQQLPQVDVLPDIESKYISTSNNSIVEDQINILKSKDLVKDALLLDNNFQQSKEDIDKCVNRILSNLQISSDSKNSFTVNLALIDTSKVNGEKFLENLLISYENKQKNFLAKQANSNISFIKKRIYFVEQDLKNIEDSIVEFRKNKKVPLNSESANVYWSSSFKIDSEIHQLNLQQSELKLLNNLIEKNTNEILTIGSALNDLLLKNLIVSYNEQIISFSKATDNISKNSRLNQINFLKNNIKENIRLLLKMNDVKLTQYDSLTAKQKSNLLDTDSKELHLAHLLRKRKTKEDIYLYLTQKLEEEEIKSAKNVPAFTYVNRPNSESNPVAPKKNIIYLGGLIIGLLIPFTLIELKKLFDTTIQDEKDFEGEFDGPFLGIIPRYNKNNSLFIEESLRLIISNLEFILPKKNINDRSNDVQELEQISSKIGKVIFITSTIAQEGKTFTSFHLAQTLSKSKHKVLLVGADIRSPKLDNFFHNLDTSQNGKMNNSKNGSIKGLTNYLNDETTDFNDFVIKNPNDHQFDLFLSGSIPPNPAEILERRRFERFISSAKSNYDYIIVDTAPVGFLNDTLSIAKYADATLYIARANFLEKSLVNVLAKFYKTKRLNNLCLIINDIKIDNIYGYNYLYHYSNSVKKPIIKRIKDKLTL